MGSTERRERERQQLQTQILDATRSILSERGYEGLTMRAVADRVEYSVAALYKHFADREELVRALCASDFYAFAQVLNARAGARAPELLDPIARLRGIGLSYAEFARQYPEQYRVMFMTPVPCDRAEGIAQGDPEQDAYALVSQAVQQAQLEGHFAGLDRDLVAQTLWSTVHGVVSLEISHLTASKKHIPFAPLEARVEAAVESMLLGLEALARKRSAAAGARPAKPAKLPSGPKLDQLPKRRKIARSGAASSARQAKRG